MNLEHVHPSAVKFMDIQLLVEADDNTPVFDKLETADVITALWSGDFQLFRCAYGIILAEVNAANGLRRLNLVRFAGRNIAQHINSITQALQHYARELGCNAIECNVYSDKLAKALRRSGAKQEAVVMVLELSNG